MNKHAQNLRALPVILPAGTDQAILDVLVKAAEEIDQLETSLTKHKEFAILLSQCDGGMVNGNRLSGRAKELLKNT